MPANFDGSEVCQDCVRDGSSSCEKCQKARLDPKLEQQNVPSPAIKPPIDNNNSDYLLIMKNYINMTVNKFVFEEKGGGPSSTTVPLSTTAIESSLSLIDLQDSAALRQRAYQLYMDYYDTSIKPYYERGVELALSGHQLGQDETVSTFWKAYLEYVSNTFKSLLVYEYRLPGFERLSRSDSYKLTKNAVFIASAIQKAKLFINGDYYLVLPGDIQLSMMWFGKAFEEDIRVRLAESMAELAAYQLTNYDMALIMPFMITKRTDLELDNVNTVAELNKYYAEALQQELISSGRDKEFFERFSKLLDNLYAVNDSLLHKQFVDLSN